MYTSKMLVTETKKIKVKSAGPIKNKDKEKENKGKHVRREE